jgi:hypothetical protein
MVVNVLGFFGTSAIDLANSTVMVSGSALVRILVIHSFSPAESAELRCLDWRLLNCRVAVITSVHGPLELGTETETGTCAAMITNIGRDKRRG